MKVKGLDGKEHRLALAGRVVTKHSSGHQAALTLLRELFPFDTPYEEVALPGCGGALWVDFLLPQRRLAVEVQGVQHSVYVEHFHGGPKGFRRSLSRDQRKREFFELNLFRLVELHDDRRDQWRSQLLGLDKSD